MRWFAQHPKLKILKQIAREQLILPRNPKVVILEFNAEEIDRLNEVFRNDLNEHGGISNISKLKSIGASESHHRKLIGLGNDTAGTLVTTPSKRLKKEGYVERILEAIKKIYKDKTLHKQLDKCNYVIVLKSNLLELYGKKHPVNLVGEETIKSPDNYTAGWCWVLIHEFVHIIEIENKKPIFDKFSDSKREAERVMSNYLPFEFWQKVEPMEN